MHASLVYGVEPAFFLWAKSGPPHPLWCHLIDVGSSAMALWDCVLTAGAKDRIARSLGVSLELARVWFIWLAALHDLGKAAPEFQFKDEVLRADVTKAGLRVATKIDSATPHGCISASLIADILGRRGWDRSTSVDVAVAVGSHHGDRCEITTPDAHGSGPTTKEQKAAWTQARARLVEVVEQALALQATREPARQPPAIDRLILLEIAGLISFIDWIGSSSDHFSSPDPALQGDWFGSNGSIDVGAYAARSRKSAETALKDFGWTPPCTCSGDVSWKSLFDFAEPNALQRAVEHLLSEHPDARFLLVEAPMGEGKTEAALYAARYWIGRHRQPGAYIALPTQATSNAMYERINGWIRRIHDSGEHSSLLVHGGLIDPDEFARIKRDTFFARGGDDGAEGAARLTAPGWFLSRKRSLLASYGTGTVDQALLAVLRARHHFVRLAGLAGKTIVFDEIHAYDTYTSTLIERLIAYLAGLECTVILLSATLPAERRNALYRAFAGHDVPEAQRDAAYPRILGADSSGAFATGGFATSRRSEKRLCIEALDGDLETALDRFVTTLGQRGCGAFLCNTVGDAQKAYGLAKDKYGRGLEYLGIFHSRFTAGRRAEIEAEVLAKFGKGTSERPANRPQGLALLIATQVVEQSLDLDFDLMATDLAPIDLLLQRSGRLHRHPRPERPAHLAQPRLMIRMPAAGEEVPSYGKSEKIYERAVLLRTHAELLRVVGEGRTLAIPADVSPLIEAVYTGTGAERVPESWRDALREALAQMTSKSGMDKDAADSRQICPPAEVADGYWDCSSDFSSDDEELVLTRLGEKSVRVVCLHSVNGVLCREAGGEMVPLPEKLDGREVRHLLSNVVTLPLRWFGRGTVEQLIASRTPREWAEYGVLKYLPAAVFSGGGLRVEGGGTIQWDGETGLSREWGR